MADFSSDSPEFRPPFPFLDPNLESATHFTEINHYMLDNSSLNNNFHGFLPFSSDNFLIHNSQSIAALEFPENLAETNFPGIFHQQNKRNPIPVSSHQTIASPGTDQSQFLESKKRKGMIGGSETCSLNSSPQVSDNGKGATNLRKGKKAKSKEDDEKPKEVVHVRARRGQATDSHSLAERVRRGKINERLRCLQDIVPGCYKTMGMAVMLDEIINYVQSLQNQVEFLSMKLTAASTFHDFNSAIDAIETIQREKAQEAKEMEKTVKQEYGGLTNFYPTWSL